MRRAFTKTLREIAAKNRNVYLLTGDLGFGVFEDFIKEFPDRYVNMGVAEADMIGAASGLALSGKIVYVYSIVPFATMRCFEQIRNDVCMQNVNVRIIGVGGGLVYGQLGPTHHSIQDLAIMRSLPGMTVVAPGDPIEVIKVTEASLTHQGPMYIRLAKRGEPIIHTDNLDFKLGRAIPVRDGKDVTLFVTGNLLSTAVRVSELLAEQAISARVVSMPTLKPLDVEAIRVAGEETRVIFTIEEHSIIGGLGSAVAEVLAEQKWRAPLKRFGIKDVDTKIVGDHEYLQKFHRLTAPQLAEDTMSFINQLTK